LNGWHGPAAALLAIVVCHGCKSDPETAPGASAGQAIAASFERALATAPTLLEPHSCARLDQELDEPATMPTTAGDRTVTIEGHTVRLGKAGKRPLSLVAVGDARSADPATLARLTSLGVNLEQMNVDVVIALGGFGALKADIVATLKPLLGPWLLVAIPGDRERIADHRAAVEELASAGGSIVDGSHVRLIETDTVAIATLPGSAHVGQLVSGIEGCTYQQRDADAIADELAAHDKVRVWVSYTAPRQRGDDASDLAAGGIHIGDVALATAVDRSKAHLVLHAQVDVAALRPAKGELRITANSRVFLATGAAEPAPVVGARGVAAGSSLFVTLSKNRVRWRRMVAKPVMP